MAWILHGVLGVIIGVFLALILFGSFVLLAALSIIGFGAGSRLGDRLSKGPSAHPLPPEEPFHRRRSLSTVMLCTGCALILIEAYLQYQA